MLLWPPPNPPIESSAFPSEFAVKYAVQDAETLYGALISPIVLYDQETWTMLVEDQSVLAVFGRKVFRTIFATFRYWTEYHRQTDMTLIFRP